MPHYVYLLKSVKDGGYYIGETTNVEARFKFHNAGLQRSTRYRVSFKLDMLKLILIDHSL